jgi:hypothetical protein
MPSYHAAAHEYQQQTLCLALFVTCIVNSPPVNGKEIGGDSPTANCAKRHVGARCKHLFPYTSSQANARLPAHDCPGLWGVCGRGACCFCKALKTSQRVCR